MSRIPGKLAHRIAATAAELLHALSPREIGYCTGDHTAYIKVEGHLEPLSAGLDSPTSVSLLMGFLEGTSYVYDWKDLADMAPIQDNPLRLWDTLNGKGFYAKVAEKDCKNRDIANSLDSVLPYASVLVAVFGETPFNTILAAVNAGKAVMLSVTSPRKFASLHVISNTVAIFRSPLSADNTYEEYSVTLGNVWAAASVNIGQDTPTQGSNKLLTSGGAYRALGEKANAVPMAEGTYTKVAVNAQGIVTQGSQLQEGDIPNHSASKLTSGTIAPERIGDNSIGAEKLELRKKFMVDGATLTAEETQSTVVLNALPALRRICQGEHAEGEYWIDEMTGKVMTIAAGASESSEAYPNLSACLTDLIQRVIIAGSSF